MASLESKLLDGRNVGYCSSSDEEDGDWQVANDEDEHQSNVMRRLGPSSNTGAKGVLREFATQKEAANRNKQAKLRELSELSKKGMLEMSKEEREQAQAEDSLENLRQRRLMELRKAAAGKIVEIMDKDQFTKAIDTCQNMLCVLLYEPEDEMCQKMTHICKLLAADFPRVKFVRAKSTLLRMSKAFTEQALPALQFYLNGQLVGNFIRLPSVLGEEFDVKTVKQFLRRQHIDLVQGNYTSDVESTDEDGEW